MEKPSEFTKQTCIIVTFAYTAPPLYAKLKTRTRPAEKKNMLENASFCASGSLRQGNSD